MIDLHVHSTFSDGSYTPQELVARAQTAGLTTMALTDHDGLAGLAPFQAACAATAATERPLRGIGGVEISADADSGTLHILGYCVDPQHAGLNEKLQQIRDGRENRNGKILAKLNELGCELTWDEVAQYAGEDVVGRPHFAQALLARGYVKDKTEAFERYLGKGKAAYIDRFRFSARESIAAIQSAGGVAVLAHPFTLKLKAEDLRTFVGQLKDAGLDGIEAHYSEHNADLTAQYLGLAKAFGLLVSGGSDFHGAINPDISLGRGFGQLRVPDELADAILACAATRQAKG